MEIKAEGKRKYGYFSESSRCREKEQKKKEAFRARGMIIALILHKF
jgi:hypothetical protein